MLSLDQTRAYLFEINHEAELVRRHFQAFEDAANDWLEAHYAVVKTGPVAWSKLESEHKMQTAIEVVLSGFARVSLFIFPTKSATSSKARGEFLRTLLEISETHPICDRKLRNHWMHLDERLDSMREASGEVPIGYQLAEVQSMPTEVRQRISRLVDPGGRRVYVYGEEFNLYALSEAVADVNRRAILNLLPPIGESVNSASQS